MVVFRAEAGMVGQGSGRDGGAENLPGAGSGRPAGQGARARSRERTLAGFAKSGAWDTCRPSAALAGALEQAAGPDWRCAGASRDELVGLLRQYAALESWAAAGRLGVLRALIRDEGQPLPGGDWHGDLPDGWSKSLTYESAAALAVSVPTAEAMMWLAWDLHVRLPGIAGLLADGTLTCAKARAVADAFQLLSEQDAARAEAMILPELAGKNYGQGPGCPRPGLCPCSGIPGVGCFLRPPDGAAPRHGLPRSPQRHHHRGAGRRCRRCRCWAAWL